MKDPHGVIDDMEGMEDGDTGSVPTAEQMASTEREDWASPRAEEDGGEGEGDTEEEAKVEGEEKPEQKAEAEEKPEDKKPEKPPEGFVQKGALDAERNANKELRSENRQLLATVQRWLDAQTASQQRQEPAKDEPGEEEPAEDDYVGRIAWLEKRLEKREAQDAEAADREEQERKNAANWNTMTQAVGGYWKEKAAEQPDLNPIWNALRVNIAQEMMDAWGITDREQLVGAVNQRENDIIAYCYQNQKPIDVVVRAMAKARGITPEALKAAAEQKDQSAGPGNDEKKEQPRAENGQFKAEQEKAERIKQGQERNGSLSQASGVPVEKMNAKEFAKMSEEDQIRFMQRVRNTPQGRDFERELGFA